MSHTDICFADSPGRSPRFLSLDTLLASHLLIQGTSGSGKSYTLRVLAEAIADKMQVIVIDPEGEYSSLREKYPFVLVGEGGETPAAIETASLLANRLMSLGCSAICDLYSLEKEDQQAWVKEFLTALIHLPREMWRSVVVMIDEAHLFAPEKGEGSALSTKAVEDLVSRGRKHGIGIVLATQRITKLSNNCVSECQNYLIGRTFIQTDRERAARALGVPKRQAEMDQFYADLKVLKRGEFWALGVALSDERLQLNVHKAQTTHPDPGILVKAPKIPTPEKIRALLPKLADLPKQAAEEQDEVQRLSFQVANLQGELERVNQNLDQAVARGDELASDNEALRNHPALVVKPLDLQPLINRLRNMSSVIEDDLQNLKGTITGWVNEVAVSLEDLKEDGVEAEIAPAGVIYPMPKIVLREDVDLYTRPAPTTTRMPRMVSPKEASGKLPKTARKMAEALVGWYPHGISPGRLGAQVGIKARGSGHFSNMCTELRNQGCLEIREGLMFATPQAVRLVGKTAAPAARTTRDVMALWRPKLSTKAYQMLEVLVRQGGRAMSKADLARQVQIEPEAGHFTNMLSELRTAEFVVSVGGRGSGMLAANKETLFL